jgi:hypothetical protein
MKRVIVLLLAGLSLFTCGENKKAEVDVDYSEQEKKVKAGISEMVLKHNANETWLRTLAQLDSSGVPITTLHLQQALPETSTHPYLFYVAFDDLFKQGGNYFASFVTCSDVDIEILLQRGDEYFASVLYPIVIYFELSCTQEQSHNLLNAVNGHGFANFAIIARVHNIQKFKYSLDAIPSGPEEAYIEIEPSRAFLIRGELLDFVYSGEGYLYYD